MKTARKRTLSSTLWLQRQLNDPYVARAKREGWRSRAAFKLLEIDEKYHLLQPGQRIVDLARRPAAGRRSAAKKVKPAEGKGKVVGIDLLDIEPIAGVDFAVQDFLAAEAPERAESHAGRRGRRRDFGHGRQHHRPQDDRSSADRPSGGARGGIRRRGAEAGRLFLCKLFQGGETGELVTRLKRDYAVVRHVKPGASRAGFGGALRAGDGLSRLPGEKDKRAKEKARSRDRAVRTILASSRISVLFSVLGDDRGRAR